MARGSLSRLVTLGSSRDPLRSVGLHDEHDSDDETQDIGADTLEAAGREAAAGVREAEAALREAQAAVCARVVASREAGTREGAADGSAPQTPIEVERLETKYDSNGRVILYLSGLRSLAPTSDVRRISTGIFQAYLEKDGVNWRSLPLAKRKFYWTEFQNYCTWDVNKLSHSIAKELWTKQTSGAYRDLVCRVKRAVTEKKKIPPFIQPEVLNAWMAYWDTPEFKAKSAQASKNRNSEPGGPGTGMVVHFGGSRNAELHAQDLAKADNLPLGLVSYRLAKKMHYKNDKYTDGRAKMIIEEVEKMIAEARQPLPGTTQSRRVTAAVENGFYAKVVKMDAKGRLFGHGCIAKGLRASSSRGIASQTEIPVSDPRVSDLETRLDRFERTLVPRLDMIQTALEEHMQIYATPGRLSSLFTQDQDLPNP